MRDRNARRDIGVEKKLFYRDGVRLEHIKQAAHIVVYLLKPARQARVRRCGYHPALDKLMAAAVGIHHTEAYRCNSRVYSEYPHSITSPMNSNTFALLPQH